MQLKNFIFEVDFKIFVNGFFLQIDVASNHQAIMGSQVEHFLSTVDFKAGELIFEFGINEFLLAVVEGYSLLSKHVCLDIGDDRRIRLENISCKRSVQGIVQVVLGNHR